MPGGPAEQDELIGTRLGSYLLVRVLGRGRMGVVYLAHDTALLRPTAVKVLSWLDKMVPGQDPVQWFLSEARLVARINHPRVVQVYGAAQAGSRFYLAMEYVPGQSAEERLKQGPLSPLEATGLVLQVAAALQAAHRVGVVHRDVKPANVLIGPGDVVKLGDFGMALTSSAARANPGTRAGTPDYTAPEVWLGSPASPSSDLYSLGATYFHLLTGEPPYPGRDLDAVRLAHTSAPVPDPRTRRPSVPAGCAELVVRMLGKTPQERCSSAQVALWHLRRLQQELQEAHGPRAQAEGRAGAASPRGQPAAGRPAESWPPAPQTRAASVRPYTGEPFAGLQKAIAEWTGREDAPLLALTGARGSGRTTLLRMAAARRGALPVLYTDLERDGQAGSPLQALCRLAGAVTEDSGPSTRAEDQLDALLERLAKERARGHPPPLLVVDGVGALAADSEVALLAGAAVWVRSFKLMVIGEEGLGDRLASCGIDLARRAVPELRVPALDVGAVGGYARARLAAQKGPGAPLVLTPDAALLLARRSRGVLPQVDLLADNMRLLAASEGRGVLSSWHAWAASETERWSERPPEPWPERGPGWPAPAFLSLIDDCRSEAGAPPFPRPARPAVHAARNLTGSEEQA